MEWQVNYLDAILIPLSLVIQISYHAILFHRVRHTPLRTVIGFNQIARRLWVYSMMKDNEKKNLLAIQSLRNTIMGSTLMASTAILMSSTTGVFMTSTYFNSMSKPMLGGANDTLTSVKYMTLLFCFLFAFLCFMQSVRYLNHVNFLINVPLHIEPFSSSSSSNSATNLYNHHHQHSQQQQQQQVVQHGQVQLVENLLQQRPELQNTMHLITYDYVADVLTAACNFYTCGTRGFYFAFPLMLWLFGPVPALICCAALVPIMHFLDTVAPAVGSGDRNRDRDVLRTRDHESQVIPIISSCKYNNSSEFCKLSKVNGEFNPSQKI
ncbi:hypothetical protein BDL97_15G043100 [Sphagnum fallax]|nr:hypothetical protein BDL97_15G043100 [Sphagnum fallax]